MINRADLGPVIITNQEQLTTNPTQRTRTEKPNDLFQTWIGSKIRHYFRWSTPDTIVDDGNLLRSHHRYASNANHKKRKTLTWACLPRLTISETQKFNRMQLCKITRQLSVSCILKRHHPYRRSLPYPTEAQSFSVSVEICENLQLEEVYMRRYIVHGLSCHAILLVKRYTASVRTRDDVVSSTSPTRNLR
jgi:hypothetical protein